MNFTKNKWYLAFGAIMLPLGLFLTVAALVHQGKPGGALPWIKLGPVGLMLIIGGVGLLFLPDKIKFK
ncbi:MAG TPA: hypothetical protein VG347_04435 [Verrucomicrobiae bacterium]|nr:hypothetical protein [Verrucomicrobiae bacterium]